jgi:hypothetical protein
MAIFHAFPSGGTMKVLQHKNVLLKPLLTLFALAGFTTVTPTPAGGAEAPAAPFSHDISLSEIMESIVMPSADVVWNAVVYKVTANGEEKDVPQTDEDWAKLRWSAVNLAAATNLLMVPGTPVANPQRSAETPQGELSPDQIAALQKDNWAAWVAHAEVLHEAALATIRVIDARDVDGITDAGGELDAACESCHLQFWYPEG